MLYRVNRLSPVHNVLRWILNRILWTFPFRLKYRVAAMLRASRLPYRLVKEGWTVVQVGAPWDLLEAGRSRAMHFALRVGRTGRVIVLEPDDKNAAQLEQRCARWNLHGVKVVKKGAWRERKRLMFMSNPSHPASNILEDVYDNSRPDRHKYQSSWIEVDTLDQIFADLGLVRIDLLSITTNGAEAAILEGLNESATHVKSLSIINADEHVESLNQLGFRALGADDRGWTFIRPDSDGTNG